MVKITVQDIVEDAIESHNWDVLHYHIDKYGLQQQLSQLSEIRKTNRILRQEPSTRQIELLIENIENKLKQMEK